MKNNENEELKERLTFAQAYGVYGSAGVQLAVSVVLCLLGGRYLDKKWHTTPWLMLLGLLLGMTAGFINLFKLIKKYK